MLISWQVPVLPGKPDMVLYRKTRPSQVCPGRAGVDGWAGDREVGAEDGGVRGARAAGGAVPTGGERAGARVHEDPAAAQMDLAGRLVGERAGCVPAVERHDRVLVVERVRARD